jgi:hypothetical protein
LGGENYGRTLEFPHTSNPPHSQGDIGGANEVQYYHPVELDTKKSTFFCDIRIV